MRCKSREDFNDYGLPARSSVFWKSSFLLVERVEAVWLALILASTSRTRLAVSISC